MATTEGLVPGKIFKSFPCVRYNFVSTMAESGGQTQNDRVMMDRPVFFRNAAKLAVRAGHIPRFAALALGMACTALGATGTAVAQAPLVSTSPPPSPMPVPNQLELAKLIWSTMAAIDHANIAGNYSVLRDLSAPSFQFANDAAKLSRIFESLRASGVDLSNTMLLAPTYESAPTIVPPGILHVKGYFGLRPTAIGFDLYYQWLEGRWRLYGVSIVPASIANLQPGPPEAASAPVPAASQSQRRPVEGR